MIFKSNDMQEIVDEINRRLDEKNLSRVNPNIVTLLKKHCNHAMLCVSDNWLLDYDHIGVVDKRALCFQKRHNHHYYIKVRTELFNLRCAGVIVTKHGFVLRYLPNYKVS